MKLHIAVHGVELSDELKDYVTRRVHFSLGRFAGRIKSLSIRLADVNGPGGEVDQCCDIRVDAGLRQKVTVRERHASIHAAVAFAMERAERAVQRQLSVATLTAKRSTLSRRGIQFGGRDQEH
jgi:putative sigma-54 modulation protein